MWVRIPESFVYFIFLVVIHLWPAQCHFPSYMPTPTNKVQQYCELADGCVHDTIPICGRMGDQKKSFLDLCDMFEFACDTNRIFTHIEDEEECPKERPKI